MLADRFDRLSAKNKLIIGAVALAFCGWVVWTSARDLGWVS